MTLRHVLMTTGLMLLTACASPRVRDAAPGAVAQADASATLQGDAARPAQAAGWVRSELYFAISAQRTAGDAERARWQAFLDAEVTPRFPDGLTVFDADGQWLDRGAATPASLRSKVLVILHPDTPEQRARIDALRVAWKRASGDDSVLWARQPVEVSF